MKVGTHVAVPGQAAIYDTPAHPPTTGLVEAHVGGHVWSVRCDDGTTRHVSESRLTVLPKQQLTMFGGPQPKPLPPPAVPIAGETFEVPLDGVRLGTLLVVVRDVMLDGTWRTLSELHEAVGRRGTEASISARLRDLRKAWAGAYTIERRRRGDERAGLFEYRVVKA